MKIRKDREVILHFAPYPILLILGKEDPVLNYDENVDQIEGTNVKLAGDPITIKDNTPNTTTPNTTASTSSIDNTNNIKQTPYALNTNQQDTNLDNKGSNVISRLTNIPGKN